MGGGHGPPFNLTAPASGSRVALRARTLEFGPATVIRHTDFGATIIRMDDLEVSKGLEGLVRERVLVLLGPASEDDLLTATLTQRYDVVRDSRAERIDCCIVDAASLLEHWDRLHAVRGAAAPSVVPVLMLADRAGLGSLARDPWQVADDVLLLPIEVAELAGRVAALLRMRRLSLRVQALSEAYAHERAIAQRLQEEALPRSLPTIPGLAFDGYYAAGSEARVGGDWYDAFRLPDGRIVISVGDVASSGLDAAVTMANVRHVLRGVAQIHPDPAIMLDAVDRTLLADDDGTLVTAFVGIFEPVTSLLSYASAGHPRPLLRAASGALRELATTGLPLGVTTRFARGSEVIEIPPESTLVLYTDGLTDATRDSAAGEARLRAALGDATIPTSRRPAQAVHDAAIGGRAGDDVAILTMRRTGEATAIQRWTFASADADAARRSRREAARALARHGLAADAVSAGELLFAELVGNVVRYAGGETEVALDFAGRSPVLHVLDRGSGFRHMPKLPEDVLSENGRGLYIVSAMAEDFTVTRRPGGGSHARAVIAFDAGDERDPFVASRDLDTSESNELLQP